MKEKVALYQKEQLTFTCRELGLIVASNQPAGGPVSIADPTVILLDSTSQLVVTANNLARKKDVQFKVSTNQVTARSISATNYSKFLS